jgi:hypothetical protein
MLADSINSNRGYVTLPDGMPNLSGLLITTPLT